MSVQQNVQNAFTQAKNYFNAWDIPNLMTLVDSEASVYSISGQLGYHPKHAVRAYFREQFQDNPTFQPAGLPIPQFNPSNTGATVWGQATWTDKNNPKGFQILYTFTFILRTDAGGVNHWLLSSMWGS